MSQTHADMRSGSAPGSPRHGRGLIRWIGTENPFYAISAALVLMGLRASFDPSRGTFPTWALLLGLGGYTLLMALTAALLVRRYHVWEDVRSLLLLIVLVFLAIAIIFDDIMARDPASGIACDVGALIFAIVLSEGLLRSIRLRLPLGFRLPYYLVLALFYLYPVALSPILAAPSNPALPWALFGFGPLAGVVLLTLLPAARRGPSYLAKNGSPWPWPLYPWSLVAFLALGIGARSYYLCLSVHYAIDPGRYHGLLSSIFGPYFLVPWLFALALVVLEAGLAAESRRTIGAALAMPAALVILAMIGHRADATYQEFLARFTAVLGGTPLYLTLIGATAFYFLAAAWRIPRALGASMACLTALALVGPGTLDLDGLVAPRAWPLAIIGGVQAVLAWRGRDASRALLAAAAGAGAIVFGPAGDWSVGYRLILAYHLALVSVLAIGLSFAGELARAARFLGVVMLLGASAAALASGPEWPLDVRPEFRQTYPIAAAVVAFGYGSVLGSRLYRAAAGAALGLWVAAVGGRGYAHARQFVAGLDQIAWGLASFLLAALISLAKAGAFRRWATRRREA